MTGLRRALLTGIPRSGTTLCCRLLNDVHDTVALVEPWLVHRFTGDRRRLIEVTLNTLDGAVQDAVSGTIETKVAGDAIAANIVAAKDDEAVRRVIAERGQADIEPLSKNGTLVVKHNAFFAALLPELAEVVPVYAVVRNPVAVLASWRSVDLPVRDGRIPAGERVDATLRSDLERCADVWQRQLMVLDWFFTRFADGIDRSRVIRYEEVIDGTSSAFRELRASGWRPLVSENDRYHKPDLAEIAAYLADRGGPFEAFYSMDEIRSASTI